MDRRAPTRRPPKRNPSLDHPDLQALRDADAADDERFEPLSEPMKRRWGLYVIGSVICLPLVTAVISAAGFEMLWFQILVSAAYGTYVAFARPMETPAALAMIAAGLLIQLVTGHLVLGFMLVMTTLLYGLVGSCVGVAERSKLMNGR